MPPSNEPPSDSGLIDVGQAGLRCWWCATDPIYVRYHDQEWGRPVHEDIRLFEKICLEGFQAGLSWLTILRKRNAFRESFANFDFLQLAEFSAAQVELLLTNKAIVRHRGKIESTINNVRQALRICDEFDSLDNYFWRFKPTDSQPPVSKNTIPTKTPESTRLSRDLKSRGWSFVGPTTCYAFMQAMGMVNDHLVGCAIRERIEKLR